MFSTSSRVPSFKMKFSGVTVLHGVTFSIFLLIFEWALQQFSAGSDASLRANIGNIILYGAKERCWRVPPKVNRFGLLWEMFSFAQRTAQWKDVELILTVKMETRHPMSGSLAVNFCWSLIIAELWQPGVARPGNFLAVRVSQKIRLLTSL